MNELELIHKLYRKFELMSAWISACTSARITVEKSSSKTSFIVTARWVAGDVIDSYSKSYSMPIERHTCVKDLGRKFIREVLEKRGI